MLCLENHNCRCKQVFWMSGKNYIIINYRMKVASDSQVLDDMVDISILGNMKFTRANLLGLLRATVPKCVVQSINISIGWQNHV